MMVYGQLDSGQVNRWGGGLSDEDDTDEIDPVREYGICSEFDESIEGAGGNPLK